MRKLAHIINPVIVDRSSDLFAAQPITFETMRMAREVAAHKVAVELLSAQYPEDRMLVPEYMRMTPDLDRSVLDIASFRRRRRLPLIGDILDRLYEMTDADFLIYTNVDIGLMPYFYLAVDQLLANGYDAFTVTRRTISDEYADLDRVLLMYTQVGESHPGHDCFVFPRNVYPRFYLGDACIGASEVGKVLNLNLICHATQFEEFRDLHLTFHLGDDRSWQASELDDYMDHNRTALSRALDHFEAIGELRDHALVRKYRYQVMATQDPACCQVIYRVRSFFARIQSIGRSSE